MALTLRVKAGQATFSITDGAMKAEWTLTTAMSEEEIFDALMGMLRYVRQQPAAEARPPLHAVPELPDVVNIRPLVGRALPEPPVMTWAPAVKPVPLAASVEAASESGFELIPPDEMED